jgi:hypothetical protein
MVLPALKAYHGYMLPLNLALTYLWLTSLIFSSQDYSGGRCRYFSPPGVGRCGLKHTAQAFFIIGLCVFPTPQEHCPGIRCSGADMRAKQLVPPFQHDP